MTVKELIAKLGGFPDDAPVHVPIFYGQSDGPVIRVEWERPDQVIPPFVDPYILLQAE